MSGLTPRVRLNVALSRSAAATGSSDATLADALVDLVAAATALIDELRSGSG